MKLWLENYIFGQIWPCFWPFTFSLKFVEISSIDYGSKTVLLQVLTLNSVKLSVLLKSASNQSLNFNDVVRTTKVSLGLDPLIMRLHENLLELITLKHHTSVETLDFGNTLPVDLSHCNNFSRYTKPRYKAPLYNAISAVFSWIPKWLSKNICGVRQT